MTERVGENERARPKEREREKERRKDRKYVRKTSDRGMNAFNDAN